jgi:hypothetical protein
MTSADQDVDNLFSRLFTYTPRSEERTELENFCTEALAWCLIVSGEFATQFVNVIRANFGPRTRPRLRKFKGALDVGTQIAFNRSGNEIKDQGGRFDLCLSSKATSDFFIVIEVKIKPDAGLRAQIERYQAALKKHWADFTETYVLTLTPATHEATKADGHLAWQAVENLVSNTNCGLAHLYKSFADFLKKQHLAYVKLPRLSSELIQHLQLAGPFLTEAKELFGSPTFKEFFRPLVAERPVIDWAKDGVWYGIHGTYPDGWRYAGFYINEKIVAMYAELKYAGNRRGFAARFDSELTIGREAAREMQLAGDEFDSKSTTFFFARKLPRDIDSSEVLSWFGNVFSKMQKIAVAK